MSGCVIHIPTVLCNAAYIGCQDRTNIRATKTSSDGFVTPANVHVQVQIVQIVASLALAEHKAPPEAAPASTSNRNESNCVLLQKWGFWEGFFTPSSHSPFSFSLFSISPPLPHTHTHTSSSSPPLQCLRSRSKKSIRVPSICVSFSLSFSLSLFLSLSIYLSNLCCRLCYLLDSPAAPPSLPTPSTSHRCRHLQHAGVITMEARARSFLDAFLLRPHHG